ncbi:MAG: ABC transporter substrate-binding protein [Pelagimonas sp.]|jgi:iron(III) transport system substrate-binding protein|nr:ABC transporter substrate-binding protein [Pelagimonas sp.]
MRRYLLLIAGFFAACASLAAAQDWEDRLIETSGAGRDTLRILSSTDAGYLAPVLAEFAQTHGDLTIDYMVSGTADIYRLTRQDPAAYDIVISSAMDLQIKLVNDGYARALPAIDTPDWAHWRQSLFGFTAEPAAIVVHADTFADRPLPDTRQELIRTLRATPEVFGGKLATYDIRKSGLGYLFATQDARTSETYWRLTEVMGALGTRLYCCSGDMIDAVASGEMLVAYNVLGSYAAAQAQQNDQIKVIIPSDFATTMMRSALVTRDTHAPDLSQSFISFLLAYFARQDGGYDVPLPQLLTGETTARQELIPLEPALMIYLDRLKRQAFTHAWESAVIQ